MEYFKTPTTQLGFFVKKTSHYNKFTINRNFNSLLMQRSITLKYFYIFKTI